MNMPPIQQNSVTSLIEKIFKLRISEREIESD